MLCIKWFPLSVLVSKHPFKKAENDRKECTVNRPQPRSFFDIKYPCTLCFDKYTHFLKSYVHVFISSRCNLGFQNQSKEKEKIENDNLITTQTFTCLLSEFCWGEMSFRNGKFVKKNKTEMASSLKARALYF